MSDPGEEIIAARLIAAPSDSPLTPPPGAAAGTAGPVDPYVYRDAPEVIEPPSLAGLRETIHRSPWLTVLMVGIVMGTATTAYLITSVLSFLVAMAATGEFPADPGSDPEVMSRVMQSRLGIFIAILPSQLSLILFPIAAAYLMPEGARRGLRLVRGRWPIWIWIAAAAATPLVGLFSSILVSGFAVESEALKMFTETFRAHSRSGFLIPIALLIGVAPALCEEILFRGFLQPRLNRLLPPTIGIFLASAAFAAYHLDPVHVIAVFPLGLWLGFLSYRSGSLFPAMLGHFVNNVLSVVGVAAEDTTALDIPDAAITIPIIVGGGIGLLAVLYASLRWRIEQTVE